MRQTRIFGILGASLLIPAVADDISRIFGAILLYEGEIENSVVYRQQVLIVLAGLVGILALFRIVMLVVFKTDAYIWIALSWLLLAIAICGYILRSIPSIPVHHCNDQGICFGLYDATFSLNSITIVGCFFMILSLVRFLSTLAYVFKQRRLI
ncbi:MAG: hypothetical protein IPL32_16695 [Chloracidobacterium sp.]|nr:hypothetical protein [Chloracidobacterium sp.]